MKKFKEGMSLMDKVNTLSAGDTETKAALTAMILVMGPDAVELINLMDGKRIEGKDIIICAIGLCKGDLNLLETVYRIEDMLGEGDLKIAIDKYKAEHPGEDIIKEALKQKIERIRAQSGSKKEAMLETLSLLAELKSRQYVVAEALNIPKKEEPTEPIVDILATIKRNPK